MSISVMRQIMDFKKVTGAYLARIDSDDIWYPQKLEKTNYVF